MSILVVAENSNTELKSTTLNCITAASEINDDIHVITIGNKCEDIASKISKVKKVKKVEKVEKTETEIKAKANVDISPPIVVKRKRGRPKKIRLESDIKVVKVKKKRGRKPKINKDEVKDNTVTKKKRGRKRRDRFYSLSTEQKSQLFDKKRPQLSLKFNFFTIL